MGIYNGENYIEKQLDSILHQSIAADEVILCDDCSGDNTVSIVERFIKINHLEERWKLYQNSENKGYPNNFYYAMNLCTKDLVFLADQDDVWHEKKIEMMRDVFETCPDVKACSCKFGLIDEKGHNIRSIMQPVFSLETGKIKKITLEKVFYKCEWPGMVLAYRREWFGQQMVKWKEKGKNVGDFQVPHDLLVCIWSAEADGFWQLDKELAYHRRHDRNAGREEHRLSKVLDKDRKLWEIEQYCRMLEELRGKWILCTESGESILQKKEISMRERYRALYVGRFLTIIGNAWRHRRIMRIATVVGDILIAGKAKR